MTPRRNHGERGRISHARKRCKSGGAAGQHLAGAAPYSIGNCGLVRAEVARDFIGRPIPVGDHIA
eukprot:6071608-Pyramimonas_sp.AAC.1